MAKKNEKKVVDQAVVVTDNVVTQEEIQMNTEPKAEVVVSKAQKALAIFTEESTAGEEKLRARVIARFKSELDMKDAGASTYFQNTKKLAAGEKVKHYYKPKSERGESKTVDNSSDDVPESFEVKLLDGTIKVFLSQQEADLFIEANTSIVDPDQSIEGEAEAA